MRWRRSGVRVAAMVTALILIALAVFSVLALTGGRRGGGGSGIQEFNACISGSHFLVLVRRRDGSSAVETIRDRERSDFVGEVTVNRVPPATLGGSGAENDGYVMSTATGLGRDARTIQTCWDGPFPTA